MTGFPVFAAACPTCHAQVGLPCTQPSSERVAVYPCPARLFPAYFNVADELSEPTMGLEDLEAGWVADARTAATALGLPWPPDLAAAEEHALAHPQAPVAWERPETDACERGTPGCAVLHSAGTEHPCETW